MNRLILLIFCLLLTVKPALAGEDEGSAAPKTPYFAAFSEEKTYVRFGPGKQYPVKWIYRRKGLPVEVTHTYESWRKIRLPDKEIGWVNRTLLTPKRSVLLQGEGAQAIYKDADLEQPVARAMPGLILQLEHCDRTACEVKTETITGWVERKNIWGIYADEQIP